MSRENVEMVRRSLEAWNRQDAEWMSENLAPDVEIDASDRVFNPQVFRGTEGVMRLRREVAEVWEEFRLEIEDLLPVGDDVVVLVHSIARGRAGGVRVDFQSAWVVSVRDQQITRFRLYRDRSQALEAAGLEE